MESIAAVIEEQKSILTYITRMEKEFNIKPREAKSKGYAQVMLEDLEQNFKAFKDGHDLLMSTVRNDSLPEKDIPYLSNNIYYTCCDKYISYKTCILDLIFELDSPQTPTVHASTFARTSHNETFVAGVRLPKIHLPTFSGDYLDWISYRDTFLSLVHEPAALTDIQKFLYLKSSCTGTPLSMVNEYPVAGSSYTLAWEALERRFHNERKLVDQILKRLFGIPVTAGNVNSVKNLLDTTRNCLAQLKSLKIDTTSWDSILVYLTSQKLDIQIRKEWEQSLKASTSVPPMSEMLTFLETTFRALECIEEENTSISSNKSFMTKNNGDRHKPTKMIRAHTSTSTMLDENCPCCNKRHPLYKCFKFATISSSEKVAIVNQHRLCRNCLRSGHLQTACKLSTKCQRCGEPHHTILHNEFCSGKNILPDSANTPVSNTNQTIAAPISTSTPTTSTAVSTHHCNMNTKHIRPALLATVKVIIKINKAIYYIKALVDPGSQVSFISEDLAQLLPIPKFKTHIDVCGIGGNKSITVKKSINLNLYSTYDNQFKLPITALVVPSVSSYVPPEINSTMVLNLPKVELADKDFLLAEKIDILLGNDVYGEILRSNSKKLENGLFLQETHFGYMVSGSPRSNVSDFTISANLCSLKNQLKLFWEQEELLDENPFTTEEVLCEKLFNGTHTRDDSGRYTVHLPFKSLLHGKSLPQFSHTDYSALKRLKQQECTFTSKPKFSDEYKKFMNEYETLNHMVKLGEYPHAIPKNAYFFPHHGVLRESSTTTKLRVVFDGRNKRPPHNSINEELAAGPALQNDLSTIISRWRRHRIAFTADLEKMFRQINVCKEHQPLQCILWRDDTEDEENRFPIASKILRSDTYVDDVISGADNFEEARKLQQQLCLLLKAGGFHLRKWNSNSSRLLNHIPEEDREKKELCTFNQPNMAKALGLNWDITTDSFCFTVNINFSKTVTKRTLLSDAAKLFDPLGWLAPTTVKAKITFQQLWKLKHDWDDILPIEIQQEWQSFRSKLKSLENLRIPRWLGYNCTNLIDLHGFSDASQTAYAAVVYARIATESGEILINLLQSKTKVGPLKNETIPRLELSAAALLAKLVSKIKTLNDFNIGRIVYWTDSTIVLAWLKTYNKRLEVYVANRVAQIQKVSDVNNWRYIPSADNPADCASRGLFPEELLKHSLWWKGPHWLKMDSENWPSSPANTVTDDPDEINTKIIVHTTSLTKTAYPEITSKFSNFSTMIRVTAYVLRYFENLKRKAHNLTIDSGFLKTWELTRARNRLIQLTQAVTFREEIHCLKSDKPLPRTSRILKLAPFLDELDILRVGGRISRAEIPFHTKHPILLTKQNPLSLLIFSEAHKKTCHGSLLLMQSYVSRHYWIVSAREVAKRVQRECIVCFKYKSQTCQQLMGNLPAVRLQPTRSFKHSGLDYAGPINIKNSSLRNASTSKGYICLFICMCTKAIHLEAVTSLNVDAFLAAFRRFTSRRGICTDLYSDCGTNFVGANKELKVMYQRNQLSLPEHLAETLANQGTKWHFIPPASPHFGGLWEAGVKSTKYHLRRIVNDRILTYEELSTLLAQIEGILNSRPLCPLSTDPEDHNALTPAHFLIGEPTVCIPDEDLIDANMDRLCRWKQIERLKQHFWERWNKEYMCRLQSRPKWNKIVNNVQVGDLVLLLHEKSVPGQWPLARVEEIHPGPDGLVRVVTLYCNKKYIKRPISKVCRLPPNEVTPFENTCSQQS